MTATLPVSFYIPVKNGADFIGACLESVLQQTLRPERIVIFYSPSTDDTREIIARYPVELIDLNAPLSDTRNIAVTTFTHDWIASCDADVVLAPDWLERLWHHRHDGYAVIAGNTQERIQTAGDLFRSLTSPHNWGPHDVCNPYMLVPDMLAHRPTLYEAGGFQNGWINYEDSDMAVRLKMQGHRYYYAADALAEHWRSDTPFSCLDLRWRHSFQRQAHLYRSADDLRQKQRNNIALATLVASLAVQADAHSVLPICLQLPLHHCLRDAEHLSHEASARPGNLQPQLQTVYDRMTPWLTPECTALWERAAAWSIDSSVGAACVTDLLQFTAHLEQLVRSPRIASTPIHENPWAIDDATWNTLWRTAQQRATEVFAVTPIAIHHHTDDHAVPILPPGPGLLTYRQRLFPQPLQYWNCRALTSALAEQGRALIWTETFQGSTAIVYE